MPKTINLKKRRDLFWLIMVLICDLPLARALGLWCGSTWQSLSKAPSLPATPITTVMECTFADPLASKLP